MYRSLRGFSRVAIGLLLGLGALATAALGSSGKIGEWSGVVASVDGTRLTLSGFPGSFRVDGGVTESLTGRALSASDIRVGASVTLKVDPAGADGVIPVRAVALQTAPPLGVTGELEAISGDGSSIRVQGITIGVDAQTAVGGASGARSIATLKVGRQVRVTLSGTAAGIRAAEVMDDGEPELEENETTGVIQTLTSTVLTLADGTTFQIAAATRFVDSPAAGDTVEIHFHVDASGASVADRVETEDVKDPGGEVEFRGAVEAMSPTSWTVAGKTVSITAATMIEGSPAVGDEVDVHAHVSGTTLVADRIEKKDAAPPQPNDVEFEGTVEVIGTTSWTISGKVVTVDSNTVIEHSPKVGDRVEVHAIQSGTSFLATKIEGKNEAGDARVEFSGVVESTGAQWTISGTTVTVTSATRLKDNPGMGDTVNVRATKQADGSLLASEIGREDNGGDGGSGGGGGKGRSH